MKTARVLCLLSMLLSSTTIYASLDAMERAKRHAIEINKPAVNFFEGAVLGNGGMGVIVKTRPDAIVLHFGHNNVWDIRITEQNKEKFGTFVDILARMEAIPDSVNDIYSVPWYREYRQMCHQNYESPYPRPFPCGSFVLAFDRREVELLGHRLDISNGLCEVNLLIRKSDKAKLQIFTEMESDRVWMRLVDKENKFIPNCFTRMQIYPDPLTPKEFPRTKSIQDNMQGLVSFTQILPALEPADYNNEKGNPADRAFRLTARVNQSLEQSFKIDERTGEKSFFEGGLSQPKPLLILVQLDEGPAGDIAAAGPFLPEPDQGNYIKAFKTVENSWETYWQCSGVRLDDQFLEKIWYQNSYFINCAIKEGAICPGLFANWSYKGIGTAWHGDYHLDYNWQQPFWFTFSSNHLDKNIPYIDAVYHMLPVSRQWAKDYYGMRGAFFPVSAYPVEMTTNPYPCPDWGWQICMTPWAVQGLWWHYLYSMDTNFLKERLFPPIKEAVLFMVDYMKRPGSHGERWGDDAYHIYPTVVPELYGRTPLPRLKYDCLVDLTLTKFIFKAYLDAVRTLDIIDNEEALMIEVRDILSHYPAYPMVKTEKYGEVFVSVPGEHPEIVYSIPNSLITVFPGEEHGLSTSADTLEILRNSWRNLQVEGGNEVVFQHIQAARLGMLDLERFKRQVKYCLLPNGTATNNVLQAQGRYSDRTEFDFMAPMGIWFENFSLPMVINECLMQSYDGVIRLFPNWPVDKEAEFSTLRAVGAFLVSASFENGEVLWIEIESERGSDLRIILPWEDGCSVASDRGDWITDQPLLKMKTVKGERIRLLKKR